MTVVKVRVWVLVCVVSALGVLAGCSKTVNVTTGATGNGSSLATLSEARSMSKVALEVTLPVTNKWGIPRTNEPVSSGIPFAKGIVFDPGQVAVYRPDGTPVTTQVHQLGISHSDGSFKWALVQFMADVLPGKTSAYKLVVFTKPSPPATGPLRVLDTKDGLAVETGTMRLQLSRSQFHLPGQVWLSTPKTIPLPLLESAGSEMKLVADHERFESTMLDTRDRRLFDASGVFQNNPGSPFYRFGIGDPVWNDKIQAGVDFSGMFQGPFKLTVEERGPVRAVILFEKDAPQTPGSMGVRGRIYLWANRATTKVELTLVNYDRRRATYRDNAGTVRPFLYPDNSTNLAMPEAKHIREYQLAMHPVIPANDRVIQAAYGMEKDGEPVSVSAKSPSRLLQDELARYELLGTDRSGRTAGWLSLSTKAGRKMTVAMKNFWEMFPKGLGWNPEAGTVTLDFWPRHASVPDAAAGPGSDIGASPAPPRHTLTLSAGHQRTYEFAVSFEDVDGRAISAMTSDELSAHPDPAYLAAADDLHKFVPMDDPGFTQYRKMADNTFFHYALLPSLYGDLDYGDREGDPNPTAIPGGEVRTPVPATLPYEPAVTASHAEWNLSCTNRLFTAARTEDSTVDWNRAQYYTSRYNNYHGGAHELFTWYLASRRPEYFKMAEAMAAHSLDIDTIHWTWDAAKGGDEASWTGGRGAFNARWKDHATLLRTSGQMYLWYKEFVDWYLLTGKRRVLDTLLELPKWRFGLHQSRHTAIPLLHMLYVWEAIGREDVVKARYPGSYQPGKFPFRTDAAPLADAKGFLNEPGGIANMMTFLASIYRDNHVASNAACDGASKPCFSSTSFMATYPVEGFYRYWKLTGDAEALDGVRNSAEFFFGLNLPTGTTAYDRYPARGGQVPDSRWQPMWEETQGPATWAYLATGERSWLDKGRANADMLLNWARMSYRVGMTAELSAYLYSLKQSGLTESYLKTGADLVTESALEEAKNTIKNNSHCSALSNGTTDCVAGAAYGRLALDVYRVLVNQGRRDAAREWLSGYGSTARHTGYEVWTNPVVDDGDVRSMCELVP
jgi:hypothetical protein